MQVVEHHLSHGGVSRFDKFKYYHKEYLNISLDEGGIQELAKKFSNRVIDKVVNAPYMAGAFEFISNNYKKYDMFISTATPTDEIIEILNRKKLTKFFKGIKGSPESKVDHVRQIISENNYLNNETVFIGDSDSDQEAANKNGIPFIVVTNGNSLLNEKYRIKNLLSLRDTIDLIDKQISKSFQK